MNVRILLLQARHADDPVMVEEWQSFAKKAALREEQIIPYDLLASTPTLDDVKRYDALMIGGSGDFYVSKADLPNFQGLLDLLADVVAVGHPTFGSCFGFQCLVQTLGGNIVHDPDHTEVGTFELALTSEGRADELLGYLPPRFRAQLGRKDRAEHLPDGVLNLAASDHCPFQALRVTDQPIWATQFHPELDCDLNRGRFLRYIDGYAANMTPTERDEALARFDDSPETEELLARFVRLVFG